MDKIGVIGGSNLLKSSILNKNSKIIKDSKVFAIEKDNITFIQRHGKNNVSPHKINHVENLMYLKNNGINSVISLVSVGSLHESLVPGSICMVEDFISFYNIITSNEEKRMHTTPVLDISLNKYLKMKLNITLDNVVYWQTTGPRFETPAEIRLMRQFADVVGMTLGSECTIATELGLKYSAICVVDNYCNGINQKELNYEEFEKMVEENQVKTDMLIGRLINVLTH